MRSFARRPRAGLGLVLLASVGLGIARAWAAPPGYNVDEWARLPPAIRLAGCWRQTAAWIAQPAEAISPAACWQAGHFSGNPAYYLLLSIPIAFIPDKVMSAQYYAARLVTVGLGLATIWLAWLTCRELMWRNRPGGPGRLGLIGVGIAAAVALNQSFGDIVSGVNSDASAVAALGLLAYALARFEGRRRQPGQAAGSAGIVLLGSVACRLSSSSAWWLGLPVLGWWALSQFGQRVRLGVIAVAVAAAGFILLVPSRQIVWDSPQYWFNAGPTEILGATRRVEADGPLGPHALEVQQLQGGRNSFEEVQYLPDRRAAGLAGKTITFGAWLRAPQGEVVQGPLWDDGAQRIGPTVTAKGGWQWVAAAAIVSPAARTGAIVLAPPASGAPVLYDGLALVKGDYPIGTPPTFADSTGRAGEWDGRPFTNLLLNPSAEATWPELRTEGAPRDFVAYNGRIRSFLAWRRTAAAYPSIASWLFAGFWSEFSGLHPGLSVWQLIPLGLFTAAGAAGAVLTAFTPRGRARPELRRVVRFFAPIAAIVWSAVILRADLWPNLPAVLSFAGARYALAATVPTMALLTIGGLYWLPARAQPKALAALVLGLWFVGLYVLLRVQIPFYECLLQGNGTGSCLGGG